MRRIASIPLAIALAWIPPGALFAQRAPAGGFGRVGIQLGGSAGEGLARAPLATGLAGPRGSFLMPGSPALQGPARFTSPNLLPATSFPGSGRWTGDRGWKPRPPSRPPFGNDHHPPLNGVGYAGTFGASSGLGYPYPYLWAFGYPEALDPGPLDQGAPDQGAESTQALTSSDGVAQGTGGAQIAQPATPSEAQDAAAVTADPAAAAYRPEYQPQAQAGAGQPEAEDAQNALAGGGEPPGPQPATILVFKDGRPDQQIHNYVLTSTTLYRFGGGGHVEIPLSEIDIPATVKANFAVGVDFQLPASH